MINVFGSDVGPLELAAVKDCIDRQWLGSGPRTHQFEHLMSDHLGVDDFLMVNSGSNALYLALKVLDLPPGTEVIVPSFTWVSCAHAVVLNSLRVVFCDVELDSHNVSADTIAAELTPATAAVMVVHYAGKPVEMGPITDLGVPVIEDCAHAVDSRANGRACGTFGDIAIFSFDAIKNIAVGEGGGICATKPELLNRARQARYCGIDHSGFEKSRLTDSRWWEYEIRDFDHKYLASDVAAAIGCAQFSRLREMQERRKAVWNTYQAELAGLSGIHCPVDPAESERHSYFTYCIRLSVPTRRDALARFLLDRGIYTTLRYYPLHMNPIYATDVRLPNCELLAEAALNLPLHSRLTDDDLAKILDSLREFGRIHLGRISR